MLREMIEYGGKIQEELKAIQSEKRKTYWSNINDLQQKEEMNIHMVQKKKQELKKKIRRGLGTSGTMWNIPTSKS